MKAIDEQIKFIKKVDQRIVWLALLLSGGFGFFLYSELALSLWAIVYLCLTTAFISFSLFRDPFIRKHGRIRLTIGTLIGLAVFLVTFFNLNGILAYIVAPIASAIIQGGIYTHFIIYRLNPAARYDDQLIQLLSTSKARQKPASVYADIEKIQQVRLQKLKTKFEHQLQKAERNPTSKAAHRHFRHLISELTLAKKLPVDMRRLLGRAYYGLALFQNANIRGLEERYKQVTETLKSAQKYPLPPESVDFMAQHFATRQDQNPIAINSYTAYIQQHAGQPHGADDLVYQAARTACLIKQNASSADLKVVEKYARAFFQADDQLGWAALSLGQSLLRQSRSQLALDSLKKAVALMPNSFDAYFAMGQAYQALHHTNLAVEALRQALRLNPQDIECKFLLGTALVADGRAEQKSSRVRTQIADEALAYLSAVIETQPQRAEAHYALGLTYLALNNFAVARDHLAKAVALNNRQAEWHYHYARTQLAVSQPDQAIATLQTAVHLDSQHRPALLLLGSELLRQQKWEEAATTYQKLLSLREGDDEASIGLGIALFEQGYHQQAVDLLQSVQIPTRDSLFVLGRAQAMIGRYQDNLQTLQKAIQTFGADAELYYRLGCVHAHLQQYDLAYSALSSSLASQISDKAYRQRGHVQLIEGNHIEAQKDYEQAIKIAPTSADAHHALGVCHAFSNQPSLAQAAFAKALKLNPNHVSALLDSGTLAEATSNLIEAKEALTKATMLDNSNGRAFLRLGVVAYKLEQPAEAIAALQQAQQVGSETDELFYYLGLAQTELRQWQEALVSFSILQKKYPHLNPLQKNIAECHYQLGFQLFSASDFASAIQNWEACADTFSNSHSWRQGLAEACVRRSLALLQPTIFDHQLADDIWGLLHKARELGSNGDAERVSYCHALGLMAAEDYMAAVRQLAELDKGNYSIEGRIAYHLGFAYWQAGEFDNALPHLEKAMHKPLPAHLQLGAALMLAGVHAQAQHWVAAAEMYEKSLVLQA